MKIRMAIPEGTCRMMRQRFCDGAGWVMAKETDPAQLEKVPCDIQLEFELSGLDRTVRHLEWSGTSGLAW